MNVQEMRQSIANNLGLHTTASPEMIIAGIADLQEKTQEAINRRLDATNRLEEVNREQKELEKSYDDLIKESIDVNLTIFRLDEKKRLEDVVNMVKAFAESGKVADSEESIAAWVNMAKGSKENTELVREILTNLPEIKKDERGTEIIDLLPPEEGMGTMQTRMSEIAKRNK